MDIYPCFQPTNNVIFSGSYQFSHSVTKSNIYMCVYSVFSSMKKLWIYVFIKNIDLSLKIEFPTAITTTPIPHPPRTRKT